MGRGMGDRTELLDWILLKMLFFRFLVVLFSDVHEGKNIADAK